MIKFITVFIIITLAFNRHAAAQGGNVFSKETFVNGSGSLPYRILLPEKFDSGKHYPVVLFLHGEAQRGNDNESQLSVGSGIFLEGFVRHRPVIVVFPQCPANDNWSNATLTQDATSKKDFYHFQPDGEPTNAMSLVIGLEKELLQKYPVDSNKIYVMGVSMGGSGTYEIVRRMPGMFAAAIPMAGGADSSTARAIKKTAFWVFHGQNDKVIPVETAQNMLGALQQFYTRADMQFTVYSGIGHNCWDKALAEPELLSWLFSQRLLR